MLIRSLRRWLETSETDRNETAPARAPAAAVRAPAPSAIHANAIARSERLFGEGRFGEALDTIDAFLGAGPADGELLFVRASHLFAWGRSWEARTAFLKASSAGHDSVKQTVRLAWCCLWANAPEEAIAWMRKAVAANPRDWENHFGLATFLHGQQHVDEAVASLEHALALAPDNPHCLATLVNCRLAQGRDADAVALARRTVSVHATSATAWTNLAVALITQDQFDEALDAFQRAHELEREIGTEIDENVNLGLCLRDAGRCADAIALFEQKLPDRPAVGPLAHYGVALLTAGRLRDGWGPYEFRWMQEPMRSLRLPFRKPRWTGQDLRGKTILLRSEQGVGDVIQFIRYAPYVKALGARVLLQLRKGIDELAAGFRGIDAVVPPNTPYPEFDFYSPLISLAGVFGTDLDTVPDRVPYIDVDPARVEKFRTRIGEQARLNVGLVWAGDPAHLRDRYRSVSLAALAPLAQIDGVRFHSLQKGPQAAEVLHLPAGMDLVDLGPDLGDYADTAAAISLLDLVICVDTSVAHLAGALGKPVWVLVPKPADWRWMETREDSPWYPTMRLFRQRLQAEWSEAIERVADALAEIAAGRPIIERTRASSDASPAPIEPGTTGVVPGICAVSETRVGILEYLPDQPHVGDAIALYGECLQPELELVGRFLKPGSIVIEAGAGIGAHAIALAAALGPHGHLFVYESRPKLQRVLRQNLAANGVTNVTVMRRGLGAPNVAPTRDGRRANGIDPFDRVETIDELRLERLDWLKIADADPHPIVEGATQTLWRLRPLLLARAADWEAVNLLAGCLRDFGYRTWCVETRLFNPDNFNHREKNVFGDALALAVLAIPEETEVDVTLAGCRELHEPARAH